MESNKQDQSAIPACGPDCTCNEKRGISIQIKVVLLLAIFLLAGAVLANSIIKKGRNAEKVASLSYAAALAIKPDKPPTVLSKDSAAGNSTPISTFTKIASLSNLNTVAQGFDGVFVLLTNSDQERTPTVVNEINAATNAISTHGVRMGSFQLNKAVPDFGAISAQLPPPCIIVAMKGRSMSGIPCANLTQDKLLQTCIAAMQSGGCCPGGNTRNCTPGAKASSN